MQVQPGHEDWKGPRGWRCPTGISTVLYWREKLTSKSTPLAFGGSRGVCA